MMVIVPHPYGNVKSYMENADCFYERRETDRLET